MRTLCFDFGNTRLKFAVFDEDKLTDQLYLPNANIGTIKNALKQFKPARTILSSVINHNPALETLLQENAVFHKLSSKTKVKFTIPVGKPETIGADRLALCSAAVHFFPGKNNLIIGLGSAITYNFINQYHQFLGGSISPGMDMRFRSLHEYTAKLPLATADWTFPLIGYDTKTNLQSGVIYGMIAEMDGIIEQYRKRFGNFNAVLTGGNSAYFAGQLKSRIFADPNFLFKGLYALSEINNQKD